MLLNALLFSFSKRLVLCMRPVVSKKADIREAVQRSKYNSPQLLSPLQKCLNCCVYNGSFNTLNQSNAEEEKNQDARPDISNILKFLGTVTLVYTAFDCFMNKR